MRDLSYRPKNCALRGITVVTRSQSIQLTEIAGEKASMQAQGILGRYQRPVENNSPSREEHFELPTQAGYFA